VVVGRIRQGPERHSKGDSFSRYLHLIFLACDEDWVLFICTNNSGSLLRSGPERHNEATRLPDMWHLIVMSHVNEDGFPDMWHFWIWWRRRGTRLGSEEDLYGRTTSATGNKVQTACNVDWILWWIIYAELHFSWCVRDKVPRPTKLYFLFQVKGHLRLVS